MLLFFASKFYKFTLNSYSSIMYDAIDPILTTPDPDEKQKSLYILKNHPILELLGPKGGSGVEFYQNFFFCQKMCLDLN